jgi:serine/threonine protein kinase
VEREDDGTQTHVVPTKGTIVGHYWITEKIGAGGMGEVFLARDTRSDRKVALKSLPLHLCQNEGCQKRAMRGAINSRPRCSHLRRLYGPFGESGWTLSRAAVQRPIYT